jgi:hypothetical protein
LMVFQSKLYCLRNSEGLLFGLHRLYIRSPSMAVSETR